MSSLQVPPFASASACALLYALCGLPGGRADAQGPTTAAIAGRVIDERGQAAPGVDVVVTNRATGISMHGRSRADGRYRVSGLDVGGPYAVTARRIGSRPTTQTGFFVSLGQTLQVDVSVPSSNPSRCKEWKRRQRGAGTSRGHIRARKPFSAIR